MGGSTTIRAILTVTCYSRMAEDTDASEQGFSWCTIQLKVLSGSGSRPRAAASDPRTWEAPFVSWPGRKRWIIWHGPDKTCVCMAGNTSPNSILLLWRVAGRPMTEELGRSVTMLGILSSGTRNQMMHGRVSTSEFGDFPFEIPLPCSRYSMLTIAMQTARLYLTFKLLLRSSLGNSRVSLALDTFGSCLKLDR